MVYLKKTSKINSKRKTPEQGDVIWVDLTAEDTQGIEEQKKRPVLVVSNEKYNNVCGGLVKIVPITTSTHKFPYHEKLPNGLKVHGQLMLEHERTIDAKSRNYEYCCKLPDEYLNQIIEKLLTSY